MLPRQLPGCLFEFRAGELHRFVQMRRQRHPQENPVGAVLHPLGQRPPKLLSVHEIIMSLPLPPTYLCRPVPAVATRRT